MGDPTGSNSSLDPLHKTLQSLKEIRSALLPFLRLLKDDDDSSKTLDSSPTTKTNKSSNKKRSRPGNDSSESNEESTTTQLTPNRRAEAEAAVALAIGTLRYMGARLRGLDRGRKKGDPLRMELDKTRGMLVALRKLESNDGAVAGGGKKKDFPTNKDGQKNKNATKKTDESKNGSKRSEGADMNSCAASEKGSTKKKQRR